MSASWRPTPQELGGIQLGVHIAMRSTRARLCRWADADDYRQEALIRLWQTHDQRKDLSPFTKAKNAARWAALSWLNVALGTGGSSRGREEEAPPGYADAPQWIDHDTPEALARVAQAVTVMAGMPDAMLQALWWQQDDEDVKTQAKRAGVNPQVAWYRIRNARRKLEAVL